MICFLLLNDLRFLFSFISLITYITFNMWLVDTEIKRSVVDYTISKNLF